MYDVIYVYPFIFNILCTYLNNTMHTYCVLLFRIESNFFLALPLHFTDNRDMKHTALNIFGYTDFRSFLKDRLGELKVENAKYSRRYISDRLGISSRNYLRMIIDGKRNISDQLMRKLPSVLDLNRDESTFFIDLVRYGQAKTVEAKNEALENLRRNKRFLEIHQLAMDHFDYMSDPLTLALREMVPLKNFREDADWIQSRLSFKAGRKKIESGIAKLERLGMLERDAAGKLALAHMHQATGDQLGSLPLRSYHKNMLKRAAGAMELPTDQRHYGGITMSIPSDSYGEIVERFEAFIDEVRAIVDKGDDPEQVYHLEMSLFPLTKANSEGGENK